MAIYFSDDFNRSNSDIGNGWTEVWGDWFVNQNVVKGLAYFDPDGPTPPLFEEIYPYGFRVCSHEVGQSDCYLTVDIDWMLGQNNPGLLLRYQNNANFLALVFNPDHGVGTAAVLLKRVQAGVTTILGTEVLGAVPSDPCNLGALLSGSTITATINGVVVASFTSTFGQSSTVHGLATEGVGGTDYNAYDNFLAATAPVPGDPTNLIAHAESTTGFKLTWDAADEEEDSFIVENSEIDPEIGAVWNEIGDDFTTAKNITVFYWDGHPPETRLWFRVKARNSWGDSGYSNIASVTTIEVVTVPPRSTIYEGVQIGVESVAGTLVAANVRLPSLEIDPMPRPLLRARRVSGRKAATGVTQGKEHTEGRIQGDAAFLEMAYLLNNVLGNAPVITQLTALKTWKWVWSPSPYSHDTHDTWTVEKGSSSAAAKFGFGTMSGMSIKANEGEVSVAGDIFGTIIDDSATLTTASLLDLIPTPIDPDSVDIYIGTSSSSFTKLTSCHEAEINISGRRKPRKTLNSAVPSFSQVIENPVGLRYRITVEHDSAAATLLSELRSKQTKWIKMDFLGPDIPDDNTQEFLMSWISPFKFIEVDRGDKDGLYGATYDLEPIIDQTWGKFVEVTMNLPIQTLADTVRVAALKALSGSLSL